MGVYSRRGGDGLSGAPHNRSIHKEAAENHSREGGLPTCVCTAHGGGENTRDEPNGALVVSRRGKISGGINGEEFI